VDLGAITVTGAIENVKIRAIKQSLEFPADGVRSEKVPISQGIRIYYHAFFRILVDLRGYCQRNLKRLR
jgi:hypothetical protein